MIPVQSIQDPLGHTIFISLEYLNIKMDLSLVDIKKVISTPAYIIEVEKASLYYFKLIRGGLNMMIEVIIKKEKYFMNMVMENPSAEFISELIKNGSIISFAH